MNTTHAHLNIGPILTELKDQTMSLNPQLRGSALCNSNILRTKHNLLVQSFANAVPGLATTSNEPCNFMGFVPIDGRVYELDGSRDGPIDHGKIPANKDWFVKVAPIIIQKFQAFTVAGIDFKLMAIVTDRIMVYQQQIDDLLEISSLCDDDYVENNIRNLHMLIDLEYQKAALFSDTMDDD